MMLRKCFLVTILTFTLRAGGPQAGNEADRTAVIGRPITPWVILRQGLADSNGDRRRQALLAAASIGDTPESLKFIEEGLRDKETIVRQTAATVLGQIKAPESIPALQAALDDNSSEVRFTVAKALTEMGDPMGRRLLDQVLTGERKDKPGFVAQNMKKAKKELTPTELALMGAKEAAGMLVGPAAIGIVVVEKVVKNGKSDAVSGRAIAAAELADHPDDHTRPLLEWALTDSDPIVRASAARGLGRCGNEETIPKLQTAMNDQHTAVRMMAAASVIRLSGHAGNKAPSATELTTK
jgi:HEAT repeat protein